MAYLCLQITQNRFASMVLNCFQLPSGVYKSLEIHLAAQFTWFPVVSYGLPVLASMVLNCFQLPIGDYKSLEIHLGFRWPNQKKPGKSWV